MKVSTTIAVTLLVIGLAACSNHATAGTLTLKPTTRGYTHMTFKTAYGPTTKPGKLIFICGQCRTLPGSHALCSYGEVHHIALHKVTGGQVFTGREGKVAASISTNGNATQKVTIEGDLICRMTADDTRPYGTMGVSRTGYAHENYWDGVQFNGDYNETQTSNDADWWGRYGFIYHEPQTAGLTLEYADSLVLKRGETRRAIYNVKGEAIGVWTVDTSEAKGVACKDENSTGYGILRQGTVVECTNEQSAPGTTNGVMTIVLGLK